MIHAIISTVTPFMFPLAPGGPDPPTAAVATSAAIDAAMLSLVRVWLSTVCLTYDVVLHTP